MPTQTRIYEALAGLGFSQVAPACEGAKFHSPSPIVLHEVDLPDGRIVPLCGVCRDNLTILQRLIEAQPDLPWATQREFGNKLRSLAPTPRKTHA